MASVLVAGGTGTGKSTLVSSLRAQRLHAIDMDYGYARWEDRHGRTVPLPPEPDFAWLAENHWQWIDEELNQAVADCRSRTSVLCGTAANMFDRLTRFDLLLVLQIDDATLESRVP